MIGTDSRQKSKTICITFRGMVTALWLIQRRSRGGALPRVEMRELSTGGTQENVLRKMPMMIKQATRTRKVLWNIIQAREVRPVRRRLKRMIEILIRPTVI